MLTAPSGREIIQGDVNRPSGREIKQIDYKINQNKIYINFNLKFV